MMTQLNVMIAGGTYKMAYYSKPDCRIDKTESEYVCTHCGKRDHMEIHMKGHGDSWETWSCLHCMTDYDYQERGV